MPEPAEPGDPEERPTTGERGLSRDEFEEVIRRAAELATSDPDDADTALSESEVMRIAREVGLPDRHVRRALSEVRSEGLARRESGIADRMWGPETLAVSRVVPRPREEVLDVLDRYFTGTTLLQRIRSGRTRLQYRPSVDWVSQVARTASSTARKHYVAAARRVDVRLESVGESETVVELEVDPGSRGEYLWGGTLGGLGAGGAAGVGLGVALSEAALMALPLAVVAGVGAAVVVGAGVVRWSVSAHRRKADDVRQEMEGILDRVELGESLEPPPPAWRRWVRRHFHGISRELGMGGDDEGL